MLLELLFVLLVESSETGIIVRLLFVLLVM